MPNCSLELVCILNAIFFVCCAPRIWKTEETFKAELYEKRVIFEQEHQTAISSSPEKYATWPEVRVNMIAQCKWLMKKIFPQKNVSFVRTETSEVTLAYKRIRGQDDKPFPLIRVTALECGFPKRCYQRTIIYFIKSPNSACAFFLNRLANRSTTFYIAEEICKHRKYPRFWKILSLVGEMLTSGSGVRAPYYPDDKEEQEQYERAHRKDYLKKPVEYETWPELDQKDGKMQCYTLLEYLFPGTGIDFTKVKSERGQLLFFYRRIKDENEQFYGPQEVNALSCAKNDNEECIHFVRAPKYNCVFLVKKRHPKLHDWCISKQYCVAGAANTVGSNVRMEPLVEDGGSSGGRAAAHNIFNRPEWNE